ncbi:uncharacterized protein LOC123645911 [Lemur catta]|uniref:uncharacterized protein LOC123645911 n=1 Tax=Lemur catta TaxID=9447 RepID=UPI001E26B7C9|nr:uncharacterized protein LOC123645911 [Lemur catta]
MFLTLGRLSQEGLGCREEPQRNVTHFLLLDWSLSYHGSQPPFKGLESPDQSRRGGIGIGTGGRGGHRTAGQDQTARAAVCPARGPGRLGRRPSRPPELRVDEATLYHPGPGTPRNRGRSRRAACWAPRGVGAQPGCSAWIHSGLHGRPRRRGLATPHCSEVGRVLWLPRVSEVALQGGGGLPTVPQPGRTRVCHRLPQVWPKPGIPGLAHTHWQRCKSARQCRDRTGGGDRQDHQGGGAPARQRLGGLQGPGSGRSPAGSKWGCGRKGPLPCTPRGALGASAAPLPGRGSRPPVRAPSPRR